MLRSVPAIGTSQQYNPYSGSHRPSAPVCQMVNHKLTRSNNARDTLGCQRGRREVGAAAQGGGPNALLTHRRRQGKNWPINGRRVIPCQFRGRRSCFVLSCNRPIVLRRGDLQAVLRSSVREYLCSEAMYHLGVPTTRALSLVLTGESVVRDMLYDGNPKPEPGAVVCRVAPSFIRFGNFELPASRGDMETLKKVFARHLVTCA